MKITCIIVEDEPLAVDILKDFISQVHFLQLEAVCIDAISAMKVLNEKKIDLIFLDIHLPKLTGLEFLSTLKKSPFVIITTAYHEFALKSYEYHVLDYLLKPIEFGRFMVAIQKVMAQSHNQALIPEDTQTNDSLYFTVNKRKARIKIDSILYMESQRENVKVVTEDRTIFTRITISELEEKLPQGFLRIHRSFIVATSKIEFIDAHEVEIQGKYLPIGRSYKDKVYMALGFKKQ